MILFVLPLSLNIQGYIIGAIDVLQLPYYYYINERLVCTVHVPMHTHVVVPHIWTCNDANNL